MENKKKLTKEDKMKIAVGAGIIGFTASLIFAAGYVVGVKDAAKATRPLAEVLAQKSFRQGFSASINSVIDAGQKTFTSADGKQTVTLSVVKNA